VGPDDSPTIPDGVLVLVAVGVRPHASNSRDDVGVWPPACTGDLVSPLTGFAAWAAQVREEELRLLASGAGYEVRKAWVRRVRAERKGLLQEFLDCDAEVFGALARMIRVEHPDRPLLEIRARMRDGSL
jgi:hypothetical protein